MQPPAKTILLIEDQPADAGRIRRSLQAAAAGHYRVIHVERLARGLERLRRSVVDLVLLNLSVADAGGLDALSLIQAQEPGMPVVVLSGLDDPKLAARAVREGAQDYLVKGHINGSVVVRVVRYALERNRVLARLRELDQLKSQFVSTVSHEMRTPLAIIREFVSLVQDGVTGPVSDKQHECLDAALRNCDRLTDLINDLLDLSQIESGKLRICRTGTDLIPLLRQCREDFLGKCESKKQQLVLAIPNTLPRVLCDRDKVQQVIVNLMGNAHKFNEQGVRITLRAVAEAAHVRIEVEDTGHGIGVEDQDRIFEAFTQIDRRHGPGAQGTGLGLTISRNIIQLHGGVMSLDSTPGQGCRFFFTLPEYREGAELPAFVEDRRRIYQARRKAASLVLLRASGGEPSRSTEGELSWLRRLHTCAEKTLRQRRDEMLLVPSERLLACLLESDRPGSLIALSRLVAELDPAGLPADEVECVIAELGALSTEPAWLTQLFSDFAPLRATCGEVAAEPVPA